MQLTLLDIRGWTTTEWVAPELRRSHYLGPARRGVAWVDERGCIVLSPPTARRIPPHWLDLTRWCLVSGRGSQQWAEVRRAILDRYPDCTTVVSYSDPSVGHSGALYRACNWWWAPTWHRLRPPPTGNGTWGTGKVSAPKDRWVDCLRPDPCRAESLRIKDDSIVARTGLTWVEPKHKRGLCVRGTGGMIDVRPGAPENDQVQC